MGKRIPFVVRGMGSAVPQKVLSNADFERRLETSDEWIRTRTGIRERRVVGEGESTLTLALQASQAALANAKMSAGEIDLIVLATTTPHMPCPSTACFLQHQLGCRIIPAFDVQAACSGFVYAIVTAAHLLSPDRYRNILVLGAETMSRITDYEDRTMCILFGDAAGAMVISADDNGASGLCEHQLCADGSGAQMIWIPAGGSLEPASNKTVNERLHYLKMKGREVYKFAVTRMQEVIEETLARAGVSVEQVAMIVPHQSNARIIESAGEKLGISSEKMALNIDRYGNTSAASIPLALDEAWQAGKVKSGDYVLLAGFGAGLTWASALIRL
jgi:3-oxoacyl-[acyl-carrier-protein] synthase-3